MQPTTCVLLHVCALLVQVMHMEPPMVREPILGLESMMALIEPDFVHRIYTVGAEKGVDASGLGLISAQILKSRDETQVHTHFQHMLHH